MHGAYATGDIAGLITAYLDDEKIPAAGIRKTLANFTSNSKIPLETWWELLEKVQALENKPALGIRIGQHLRPHHPGVLGYLIMHCQTVGDALSRFQRYQVLLHNHLSITLETTPTSLIMSWDPEHGESTQLSDEVYLSGLMTFLNQITTDKDIKPVSVHFRHSVQHEVEYYEATMGCPVTFGHDRVVLEIPLTALSLPVDSSDPYLLSLLEQQANALMDESDEEDKWLETLKQVVVESFSRGTPTLEQVSHNMNMSARTLHRRLESRNYNFKQFLQETRERLARLYFDDPNLSLNEIAFLLGYSEQSAFSRAFKLWFGVTPRNYIKYKMP